jgi:S-DNA-T family DNA segregation ATPase FtsK/SpoIIIE
MGNQIALGTDDLGRPRAIDLTRAPHMLVAGMTGSGKSVFTNAVISGLLNRYSPREISFLMIDPKRVELAPYRGIPHLLADPVYAVHTARELLWWAVGQMNIRYQMMSEAGVRHNEAWARTEDIFTPVLIVVDELANLILADKRIEDPIVKLASMGRAAGMHLLLATQRPSADVLTGLIRANVPMRVCFPVVTAMDSRIMLDQTGAERLEGPGRMLVRLPGDRELTRLRGNFVSDAEVDSAVAQAMTWKGKP